MDSYVQPDWPAPKAVKAFVTTRQAGNLADHVGDDPSVVADNRRQLQNQLALPQPPCWIEQVHGVKVIEVNNTTGLIKADASYATEANYICAVLTADCLPLLICNRAGNRVAAIHAGWRSLCHGVIPNTLQALQQPDNQLLAWLGPAIGPNSFAIGAEVRSTFLNNGFPESGFRQDQTKQWYGNLYTLARHQLNQFGITDIFGGHFDTYTQTDRFYSYRAEGNTTGRMASLIWFTE